MKQELFNPKRFIRLFSQTLASGLAIFFLNQFFGIAIDDMQAVMFTLLVICILLIAYLAHKSSRITRKWRTRLEASEQEFRAAKTQLRRFEERAEEFEKSSNESRKADA